MTDALRDRVALITGGSGGIGRALVSRLAPVGVDVAIGYAHGGETAESAAVDARDCGIRAMTFQVDLTYPASALDATDHVERELGRVDNLRN